MATTSTTLRDHQTRLRAAAARNWHRLVRRAAESGKPEADVTSLLDAANALGIDDPAEAFDQDVAAWQRVLSLRTSAAAAERAHKAACEHDQAIFVRVQALKAELETLHTQGHTALGCAYQAATIGRELQAVIQSVPRMAIDPQSSDAEIVTSLWPDSVKPDSAGWE